MEALKAASHRKRFGCGLKRAALLTGRRLFSVGPHHWNCVRDQKGPGTRPHLRVGRKEASESAGRTPYSKLDHLDEKPQHFVSIVGHRPFRSSDG